MIGHKGYICNKCGKLARDMKKHICRVENFHKDHVCKFCDTPFSTIGNLNSHLRKVHERKKDQIKCAACGKHFRSKKTLEYHICSSDPCKKAFTQAM